MAIQWKCHGCHRKLSIATRKVGTAIRCPVCDAALTVPNPRPSQKTKAPSAAPFGFMEESDSVALLLDDRFRAQYAAKGRVLAFGLGIGASGLALLAVGACFLGMPLQSPLSAEQVERGRPLMALAEPGSLGAEASADRSMLVPKAEIMAAKAPPVGMPASVAKIEFGPDPVVLARKPAEPAEEIAPTAPEAPKLAPKVPEPVADAPKAPEAASALKPPPMPPESPTPIVEKKESLTADELLTQLAKVPELSFAKRIDQLRRDAWGRTGSIQQSEASLEPLTTSPVAFSSTVNSVVLREARAAGLPIRTDPGCRSQTAAAREMQFISGEMREMLANGDPGSGKGHIRFSSSSLGDTAPLPEKIKDWCEKNDVAKYPGGLASLAQMLQPQDESIRLELVGQLAKVDTPESTHLLANRAMFDVSPEVRQAALEILKKRRPLAYRGAFLAGLRYPWAPVADHAAEALICLQDKAALPGLVRLLDKPSPTAPAMDLQYNYRVRELVRINHLGNCYLCHANSPTAQDLVRGLVPKLGGTVLPTYPTNCACGDFVQAQITFLRQDFSVMQSVENMKPWPEMQRFDYVVRTRKATADEVRAFKEHPDQTYPQREAVLTALRGLTARDAGTSSEAWEKMVDGKEEALPTAPSATPLPGGAPE